MSVDIATLAIRIDSLEAQNATRELERMRRAGGQAETATDSLTKAFIRFAGPAAALTSALALLKKVVDVQRQFDGMNASLITATGSAENAAVAFKALQAFAATTPYGLSEVTKAFIQMRNLGLDPSEHALRSYGGTAAAMGKSLNQLVEAVADAATGEFERLKEFGIKAKQNGDQVALTFQGVTKVVGNNAKEIEGYMQMLGDTKFAGGMELRAATLDGAISNLGDTWESTMLTISKNGIGESAQAGVLAMTGALTDLNAILDAVAGAANREGKAVTEASGLHKALTTVFEAVAVLGVNVAYTFQQVGSELGGLAAQAAAVAHGDFALAKSIGVTMKAEAAQARVDIDAKTAAILGASAKAQKATEDEAAAKKTAGRDDLARYKTVQTEAEKSAEAERKHADFIKKYATVQEQLNAELKKQRQELGTTFTADDEARIRKHFAAKDEGAKKSAEAMKKEREAYASLTVAINEKIAQSAREAAGLKPLNDAQMLQVALDEQIASGKLKLAPAHKAEYEALIKQYGADLLLIQSRKSVAAASQVLADDRLSAYAAIMSEVQANEELIATFGMSKAQIEALTVARLEDRLAQRASLDLSEATVAQIELELAARRRNAAALNTLGGLDSGTSVAKAKELLDILTAVDNATKSAADGMAASFGRVGGAIGGLTTALSGYAVQQQAIAAQLAATKADPNSSADKIAQAEIAASRASAQAKVKSYGDMAHAAKGFFKENTTGYKVLEGAEKAFRAYEMAMAVESMVKKIFFKEGEVAANLALNGTKLAGEAATTTASVGLAGTEASAWGITAVVKALASLPFPFNIAAGAATLAAVVAIGAKMMGGGGGGSVSVSEQRQAAQGTGSVFGDSSAKSDSIARSLELAAANSSIELTHTAGMLASLRNIESSLGGLGNLLIRNSGLTGAVAPDIKGTAQNVGDWFGQFSFADKILGGVVGKALGAVFGGKTSVQDTGVIVDRTSLSGVYADGVNSSQYTDTKKSGGMFHSDKYRTNAVGLGDEANDQFAKVIIGLAGGVTEAGKLLGLGGAAFTDHLNQFVVDIGKITLKGLKGEEIQAQLEAVFSKLGDDMAQFAVGGLKGFQRVGEGYMETLTRLAVNYANLDSILASTSSTFGATGLASLRMREDFIAMAGGIDELASKSTSFADNFLTEAERLAPVQKYVTEQLSAMGLSGITTRDQFKAAVLGISQSGALATVAGQEQYTALLRLADAFAKTHAATEDLTKSEQAIADERKDLQQQLNELTMTSVQLLALQRAGIAESNKALFDQVQAAKAVASAKDALSGAYDKESAALKTTVDRLKAFQTGILAFKDSLLLGSLSTLNPMEKAAEAQRQYEATLAKAKTGDTAAQSALQAAATAYLTADQVIKSSTDAYAADAAKVQSDLAALAAIAGGQATDAEKQLAALDKQVGALIDIKDSVNEGALTVAMAIANLAALGYGGSARVDSSGTLTVSQPIDYQNMGTSNMAPLVAEIRGLREDNKGLREDNKRLIERIDAQTEAFVASTYDATDRAADKQVTGTKDAAKATVWAKISKAKLV